MARAEQCSFSVKGGKADIGNLMDLSNAQIMLSFNTEECKVRYCLIQGRGKEERGSIIIFVQENIPPGPT